NRLGIGELRQKLRRYERADLDLAHPRGVLGVEPGDLLFGRQDLGDALQAVAEPNLADMGMLAHSLLPSGIVRTKASPGVPSGQWPQTTCSGVRTQASSVSASS